MAEIALENVSKVYADGTRAVRDLDLAIQDGELMVFVGPSGCGKTSALRMIAGLEEITDGTIRIGDELVNDLPPKDRDVAMIFQNYALYPHMTVGDNMGFALKLAGTPRSEVAERVRKAAEMLDLVPYLNRKPKALSGGQRQRVAMGRAIVREPAAFLMDEPLSNLDAKLRVEMRGEIIRVQRRIAAPTLYVTHDQTEAMTMGDRMAVLKAGVLNQLGTPTECYDTPNNIFVAQFVGSPPMNLVLADIKEGVNGLELHVGGSTLEIPSSTLDERPTLKGYAGKQVALGVRSEDMEDASIAKVPDERRVKGKVTLTEALGSEIIVHFTFPGQKVVTEDTKLLEKEGGGDELHVQQDEGVKWVASFAPRSRVRMGDEVEIAVDVERVHYFDPETSLAIRN